MNYNKEYLKEWLYRYKNIFNKEILKYLDSLLELELSVVKNSISNDDRMLLTELDIYKRIGAYNICNMADNIFDSNLFDKELNEYQDGINYKISTNINGNKLLLFDFYKCHSSNKIGNISLFQTMINKDMREKEILLILNKLEELYDKKNPYKYQIGFTYCDAYEWNIKHKEKISKYESMFTELDSKRKLSIEEIKEVELSNKYYNMLINMYGIKNNSFNDVTNTSSKNYSYLSKRLVKKLPGIEINKYIKYI